jgi:protocatechuate 3,4-dioxygenase beta subunit
MSEQQKIAPRDWSSHPPYLYLPYKSTEFRAPSKPLVRLTQTGSELTAPVFGAGSIGALDNDLTKNAVKHGEVQGERLTVSGRILDESGRPVRKTLVEIWQTNAAGRYTHVNDRHDAPLDPNFHGAGRCMTNDDGEYTFTTIRPGAYPWRNHPNAWRPAHIHFSLFGTAFVTRLITQMYFPGDPLHAADPVLHSVRDEAARQRLIAKFSMQRTQPDWALGYEFDIVLRGPKATPMET